MIDYYKELFYYVQRMVRDKDKTQDVIQETYARAIEVDSRIKIINKRAYLYKMARNIVIDEIKKNKNISKVAYEDNSNIIPASEQPEEIILNQSLENNLMDIVKTLPSRSKQAFILHTIDGYSRKEIALKMGITINAVEKHITRATMKIQEKLEEVEA